MKREEIIARLKTLLQRFEATPNSFAVKAKIDPSNFVKMLNGKITITKKTLEKISSVYNVSLDWLLTGEGNMLQESAPIKTQEMEAVDFIMVPIVHIDSVGGMDSHNQIVGPEYIEGLIPVTDARTGDIAIYESGDSMSPTIPQGSLIIIREIEEWWEYIGYGNVFVLLLDDYRRITKEIRASKLDPQRYFLCVSHNPDVDDEELPKKKILKVWKVIKTIVNNGW